MKEDAGKCSTPLTLARKKIKDPPGEELTNEPQRPDDMNELNYTK